MRIIATAGNTIVPALLALEALGFVVLVEQDAKGEFCRATRGEESYVGDDPVAVLGLVKLVEVRGWPWQPSDGEFDAVMKRYRLG